MQYYYVLKTRKFLLCFWTSTPSRSINTQKKDLANIQPFWPYTWSITQVEKSLGSDVLVDDIISLKVFNSS